MNRYSQSLFIQKVHTLGLEMYSYAADHGGNYPDGESSTEVFQKLLDGGYITDPTTFYIPAAGKAEPVSGQKLHPENVCFDVTSGLSRSSPAQLPVVFVTGYKVRYAAGSPAVPIIKPYPHFGGVASRTWIQWWNGKRPMPNMSPGLAVHYLSNATVFQVLQMLPNGENSIPNFISPDFKPDGKTYRQLTPDGPLP